jgi:hypothetical protein
MTLANGLGDSVMMNKIVNLGEKCKRLSHKEFLLVLGTLRKQR